MEISIPRGRTDEASLSVLFDEKDLALAFPCDDDADTDLYFKLMNDCGRTVSEELLIFSQVAKLIEDAMAQGGATDFTMKADTPEPDPDL